MVFSTGSCGCGPKEPVCSLVHCVWVCSRIETYTHCTRLHTGSLGPQPQHPVLNTICSNIRLLLLKMDIQMPETCRVIYDNKSQLLHQVGTSRHFHIRRTVTHTTSNKTLLLVSFIFLHTYSSIGCTVRSGLWPVEQYPSIFSYLSPTLSIFSLPALEDLFLLLFPSFPFVSSLTVLELRSF